MERVLATHSKDEVLQGILTTCNGIIHGLRQTGRELVGKKDKLPRRNAVNREPDLVLQVVVIEVGTPKRDQLDVAVVVRIVGSLETA
jgi:hypothetical protein